MGRSGGPAAAFDVLALDREGRLSARLTAAKATPQRAWPVRYLPWCSSRPWRDLNAAYRNFFVSAAAG